MKAKYYIIALASLSLSMAVSSCQDFLDTQPLGEELSENFFATSDGAVQATNAIYNQLRDFSVHTFSFIGIASVASDDADKGSTPGDAPAMGELDNFTATAANGLLDGFWQGYYLGIARANQVILRVPDIQMDDALKARLIGEARFLRAYFYFNLVRTYGGVPIIDELPPRDGSNSSRPRATREQTYQFIIADLNAAIEALPVRSAYPTADLGRVTKGAAQGLLAKVYMYQNNWGQVLSLTDAVINSGEYSLYNNYALLFNLEGENSSESIFEVQCATLPQGGGGSQYSEVQSPRAPIPTGGWGFNSPSEDLNNAYEAGDPRRDATIIYAGENLGDGVTIPTVIDNPRYNQKAYVRATDPRSPNGNGDSGKNIRILRYADVLLMNAEAANQQGNSAKALTDLNLVRKRARGTNANVLPDVTTTDQTALRQAIWRERRVELAMEHERFWDLVRQGRAGTVLRAVGKNFVDGKNEVFPIPQNRIDISGGLITQNPGY
ncbi:RagB/SusD family nutrient uptake outer membrane protein [Hymenobacter aerilatus]|uniref:RagB/SusD family nutrient uptake outer membrane protein n=1 Tax=Hymenobacter aerilatus TaxID=2932251 RepID=A0A8T9SZM5_9BACT|nr:RagB/SusD family nutrient uptake outer membrane protein [Hymenobacter aerilatus]UOR07325.1 RagB/SusD family nutrient uptake outer membrane protein [Hymenobacter aerilatus]